MSMVSALTEYNARFLSSKLGRFIQPDTVIPGPGNSQAWNRYSSSFNNPINFVDPTGHFPQEPPDNEPCPDGICLTPGSPGAPAPSTPSGGDNSAEEDLNTEEQQSAEESQQERGFPRCSGPVCVAQEDYYTLYFVPGDEMIPIIFQGIHLTYGIGLQMEYKSDFGLRMVWYEVGLDEHINAWTHGQQEGAVFTTLIVDYESGERGYSYLGKTDVNGSFVGTNSHTIGIPVTIGSQRDEIRRLTINIKLVVWNSMGVVKAFGYKSDFQYDVPIIAGPNIQ